jgi:nucleoside-diphosphate-sugar epimerase
MTTGMDVHERIFSSSSWLPVTIEEARSAQNAYFSYCVAKAESEKAIWAFVKAENPPFSVSVLLPGLIFGPPIQPIKSLKKINYSSDVFYSLFNGSNTDVPPTSFTSFVDVRDLAYAHVKSLTTPAVANQRFLIGGNEYSSQIAVDALKTVPELEGRLPKDGDEDLSQRKVRMEDVKEWNEKLALTPRTPVQTFGDAARRILELEKTLGK